MPPGYMLFDGVTVLVTLRMPAQEEMTMICVTHEMKFACEGFDHAASRGAEIVPPDQLFASGPSCRS